MYAQGCCSAKVGPCARKDSSACISCKACCAYATIWYACMARWASLWQHCRFKQVAFQMRADLVSMDTKCGQSERVSGKLHRTGACTGQHQKISIRNLGARARSSLSTHCSGWDSGNDSLSIGCSNKRLMLKQACMSVRQPGCQRTNGIRGRQGTSVKVVGRGVGLSCGLSRGCLLPGVTPVHCCPVGSTCLN